MATIQCTYKVFARRFQCRWDTTIYHLSQKADGSWTDDIAEILTLLNSNIRNVREAKYLYIIISIKLGPKQTRLSAGNSMQKRPFVTCPIIRSNRRKAQSKQTPERNSMQKIALSECSQSDWAPQIVPIKTQLPIFKFTYRKNWASAGSL